MFPNFVFTFRPISALPVNTDVPRLCRKILVVNGDQVIFDGSLKTFVNAPVNLVVKAMFGTSSFSRLLQFSFLESIAKFLNDVVTLDAIARDFDQIVVSSMLNLWFSASLTFSWRCRNTFSNLVCQFDQGRWWRWKNPADAAAVQDRSPAMHLPCILLCERIATRGNWKVQGQKRNLECKNRSRPRKYVVCPFFVCASRF